MTSVVFDASVAVAWYADEDESATARRLQASDARLLAPTVVLVEVANAFLTRLCRGRPCPPGYPTAGLNVLRGGTVTFTSDAALLDAAVLIAERHAHPVYDCLYLALARREEAMLATFDPRLARLAERLAVPLWSPEAAA